MNDLNQIEDMLRRVVGAICRKTANVQLKFNPDSAQFQLQVSAIDQGRCVGKKGIVIWAINTLAWYAGLTTIKMPVTVKLLEPVDASPLRSVIPFKPDANWDRKEMVALVGCILNACIGKDDHSHLIDETGDRATVHIKFSKYIQHLYSDPDIVEALTKVIHAAGMANGVVLDINVKWA